MYVKVVTNNIITKYFCIYFHFYYTGAEDHGVGSLFSKAAGPSASDHIIIDGLLICWQIYEHLFKLQNIIRVTLLFFLWSCHLSF